MSKSNELNIMPIGGFPSIIPKDLYNEINEELKRGKSSNTDNKLSLKDILQDDIKPHFLFGGDEKINII